MSTSKKNQGNVNAQNANVENANADAPKAQKGISADLLSKITGIVAKAHITAPAQSTNTIFKKEFNKDSAKGKRTKARKLFMKYCERILISAKNNDLESLLHNVQELQNVANTYYLAGDKFDKVQNYYTSQREDENSKEKREIISTVFELCAGMKDDE